MDITLLREAVTVASFLAFLGIVAYAVHPANRRRFDAAARMALDDEGPSPQSVVSPCLGRGQGEGGCASGRPSPQPSPKAEGANDGRGFENLRRQ